MARPIGPRKIYRYSEEFRATAVRLSQLSGVSVSEVAQSLDVHPFVLSRWRRAAREGRLVTSKVKLESLRHEENPGPSAASAGECTSLGGSWRRVGENGAEMCDVPTTDAGKRCRDVAECQSLCQAPAGAEPGKRVGGTCYRSFLTLGTCIARVYNGRAYAAVCRD